MKAIICALLIASTAVLFSGCGGVGYKSAVSAKNAVKWRGQTYYACKDKVAAVKTFKQGGADKKRLWQHLANLIDLKMEPKCLQLPRGGQLSLAIVENTKSSGNFLSAMTSSIPPAIAAKGKWASKFYEQGLLRGASKQDMARFAKDGTMDEWVKLAKRMG
jgi:hypothetical protein